MGGVVEQGCVKNRIRSFVILDLETTGLLYDKPVKITEISMVAALREHITEYRNGLINGVAVPRVLSKLSICISPRRRISKSASDITHLTNELLEHQSPFDEHLFNMLNGFMKRVPQPVCVIAHNGLRFDFPILQAELFKIGKAFPDHIMCADSLCGFRNLLQACKSTTPEVDTSEITEGKRGHLNVSCPAQKRLNLLSKEKLQNTLSSFKLDDVYRFLLKRDPVNSHYAENDALNLLECIVALGNGFMEWADENAIQFNSIKEIG